MVHRRPASGMNENRFRRLGSGAGSGFFVRGSQGANPRRGIAPNRDDGCAITSHRPAQTNGKTASASQRPSRTTSIPAS
jgi:hypothetical protein